MGSDGRVKGRIDCHLIAGYWEQAKHVCNAGVLWFSVRIDQQTAHSRMNAIAAKQHVTTVGRSIGESGSNIRVGLFYSHQVFGIVDGNPVLLDRFEENLKKV